ncbi:hypothetical protein ACOMHN_048465 [Nucella lapillus]
MTAHSSRAVRIPRQELRRHPGSWLDLGPLGLRKDRSLSHPGGNEDVTSSPVTAAGEWVQLRGFHDKCSDVIVGHGWSWGHWAWRGITGAMAKWIRRQTSNPDGPDVILDNDLGLFSSDGLQILDNDSGLFPSDG